MGMIWRIVRLVGVLICVGVLSGLAVGASFALRWAGELPDYHQLEQLRLRATSTVFASDGRLIGVLVPAVGGRLVNRSPVPLSEISPLMIAAFVSGEDRNFFGHYGFDFFGIMRSVFQTLVRENQQGASTITQQLIRSTILENEGTLERKIKELMLSIQIERYFTKEEILSGYLNVAFWGGNVSGIYAAAQAYFNKDPRDLTLAESVYLVVLLPAPNERFAPRGDQLERFKFLREVMHLRLARMVEDGWVSQKDADAAWLDRLQPRGWRVRYDDKGNVLEARLVDSRVNVLEEFKVSGEFAPYFMFEVRKFLARRFPDQAFNEGGLRIYTTLDPKAQRAAEAAARDARLPTRTSQLGIAGVDPATGEVRALVGGKDVDGAVGEFNRATQTRRNPGSSIKPLAYATAIEEGAQQWDTFEDAPLKIGSWQPKNYSGRFLNRAVSMRYALNHSLNLPAIRIGMQIGMDSFATKLRMMGFAVPEEIGLASVIGGLDGGTSPLQMAAAYASFVNGGVWNEPHFVRRIEDAQGHVLYPANENDEPKSRRVWTKQTAFIMLDMLQGVIRDPGPVGGHLADRAIIPGRPMGGKTGTTNSFVDLWFVGVTPQLAASVWIGRDDNKPLPYNVSSGDWPPPIWREFVTAALESSEPGAFVRPDGIDYRRVEGVSMAYRTISLPETPSSVEPQVRGEPEVDDEEPVSLPRPSITELSSSDDVVLTLDLCQDPPVLADETTEARCLAQRRVRSEDLGFYMSSGGSGRP